MKEYDVQRYNFNPEGISQLNDYTFAQSYWPVVYLLKETKNKSSAYVGETVDIVTRLTTHLNHPDKKKLEEFYLISGNLFNKSAALDIEANFIKYLSGDGLYKLLNANLGLADHNYYQREGVYLKIFRAIWEEFRQKGIVKHTLAEIDNSALFKYSPYKALSAAQTKSLVLLLEALVNEQFKSFVVEGGAGSGKTVLAVFLFKLLNTPAEDFNYRAFGPEDQHIIGLVKQFKEKYPDPKMALVIPMASFRSTVQKIFSHVDGLKANMVVGPADISRERYDIILVDEAHRLRRRVTLGTYYKAFDEACKRLGLDNETADELDWVMLQSDKNILFYDEYQSVRPADVIPEKFDALKNSETTNTQYLNSQFRVRGGRRYVKLIDDLLQCQLDDINEKFRSDKYEFLLFHDLEEMIDQIKHKEHEEQLSRVVAGYAWPWPSQKNKEVHDIEIGTLRLQWNSVQKDWINSENAINEVGCIHTVQGYDLNYAGIIFGNEIGYDKDKKEIVIRKENYYDKNGKHGIKKPAQLKAFILNIYKTLMLRGIKGTYLYVCDEALREYFAEHIPAYNETPIANINREKQPRPLVNSVRFYDLKAAAGSFSEQQLPDDFEWLPVDKRIKITDDHFACRVVGESMNKRIPNGAICLFKKDPGGSRNGKIVLVSHTSIQDADFGNNFTVKEYTSERDENADERRNKRIILSPLSNDPSFEDIVLEEDELIDLRVVGVFVSVLSD